MEKDFYYRTRCSFTQGRGNVNLPYACFGVDLCDYLQILEDIQIKKEIPPIITDVFEQLKDRKVYKENVLLFSRSGAEELSTITLAEQYESLGPNGFPWNLATVDSLSGLLGKVLTRLTGTFNSVRST